MTVKLVPDDVRVALLGIAVAIFLSTLVGLVIALAAEQWINAGASFLLLVFAAGVISYTYPRPDPEPPPPSFWTLSV